MMNLNEKIFINEASSATISDIFDNYKGDVITLQASGDASAFSAKLEGRSDINADWSELAMINLKDLSVNNAIATTDVYQSGLTGVTQIRVNLTSVSGGSVTIFGRVSN